MDNLEVTKKVLVVDDSRFIRKILARYLELSGFATCMASNGQEAFEAFQREQPDLLISDVHMPHMNGLDLTREIRAISSIPIVIMTSGSGYMEDDRDTAFDAGADAFLMKPCDLADLLGEIKVLLAQTEPSGECREVGRIGRSYSQQQRLFA